MIYVNFYGLFFRFIRAITRIIFPRYSIHITREIKEPVVYISHHQNLFGPFRIMLWFPQHVHTWMFHVFLDRKTCYHQYVDYTLTERLGWNKTIAKLCAWPLSFGITTLLNSGQGIPVYRGSRKIIQTFKQSVFALEKGENILILPDIDYSDDSPETKEMYEGFLSLEKFYYKKTGKHVVFVPIYVSKKQKNITTADPIIFKDGVDFNDEKHLVYEKVHSSLNRLAKETGDVI